MTIEYCTQGGTYRKYPHCSSIKLVEGIEYCYSWINDLDWYRLNHHELWRIVYFAVPLKSWACIELELQQLQLVGEVRESCRTFGARALRVHAIVGWNCRSETPSRSNLICQVDQANLLKNFIVLAEAEWLTNWLDMIVVAPNQYSNFGAISISHSWKRDSFQNFCNCHSLKTIPAYKQLHWGLLQLRGEGCLSPESPEHNLSLVQVNPSFL